MISDVQIIFATLGDNSYFHLILVIDFFEPVPQFRSSRGFPEESVNYGFASERITETETLASGCIRVSINSTRCGRVADKSRS